MLVYVGPPTTLNLPLFLWSLFVDTVRYGCCEDFGRGLQSMFASDTICVYAYPVTLLLPLLLWRLATAPRAAKMLS